jgi:hypothetical protein
MTAPTTAAPAGTTGAAGGLTPTELTWIDDKHAIYAKNEAAWQREERRLLGGDAVLEDLVQFDGESDESFAKRKEQAAYINFGLLHVAVITGQLRMHAPTPGKGLSFGGLGDVRSRDKIDTPTLAELLYYNVDGVGSDGSEMPAFFDGVDVRAQATGHRWLMMEAPPLSELEAIRAAAGRPLAGAPTEADVRDGWRPYLVEYSPLAVTNWHVKMGALQFAVIRTVTQEPTVEGGKFTQTAAKPGYYLLVRRGYRGLGPAFAGGGWWKFDAEKKLLDQGTWEKTRGQIPMWAHYGLKSVGAPNWPAMAASSTMELNQIAVALMNQISARDYDAWDAAASRLYFLGATPEVMQAVASQVQQRSMMIGVPPVASATGQPADERIVQVFDGSTGTVAADVFKAIVDSKFVEAERQSVQAVTSTPDSSGASKDAGFREAKAPFLATRAANRQESENTFVYFAELRFGFQEPKGYAVYPREFDLEPLVDAIDAMFATLKQSGLRSPTLAAELVDAALNERGLVMDEKKRKKITEELQDSAQQAADQAQQARSLRAELDAAGKGQGDFAKRAAAAAAKDSAAQGDGSAAA